MSGSNLCVGGLWVGLIPGVARREQGAIAAKISNVQVQDYLPAEADTGQAGDHGTLHPGAISAVWEIFCSESSQTRKMFLSCRNIKRILI